MTEGQPEPLSEDISRQFSDALEPLDLYEQNPEIGKKMKEMLDAKLDDEWKGKLLTYTNPVQLLDAIQEAGIAEEMGPGLRKAVFAFVNKRQNLNAREKADRVLADRNKPKSPRDRIRLAVDAAGKAAEKGQLPLNLKEEESEGAESLLNAYDFNELGKSCSMAMVVHVRDDGKVGFVSPHVPVAPPNTKEGLHQFWNKSFKYDQPNQYFIFFMGGEWNTINSRDETLPIPKEDLVKVWREAMERRRNAH